MRWLGILAVSLILLSVEGSAVLAASPRHAAQAVPTANGIIERWQDGICNLDDSGDW